MADPKSFDPAAARRAAQVSLHRAAVLAGVSVQSAKHYELAPTTGVQDPVKRARLETVYSSFAVQTHR